MTKRRALAVLCLAAPLLILVFVHATPAPAPAPAPAALPVDCKGGTGCSGSSCLTTITPAAAIVPTAACPFEGESQGAVDVFSWNEFVAFNWPASVNCVANAGKSILGVKSGAQGPVVWQTQMSSDDVFVAPGKTPAPWCKGPALNALFNNAPRSFQHIAKADPAAHLLGGAFAKIAEPTGVEEAAGGVLTDQSGRWVRYEKLMNKTEYDKVTANQWYRLAVLNKLKSITLPNNSIEFKAAWKVLTTTEINSGRYYTTVATVYNTPQGGKSPGKNPVTLGLVGLHIIQKTAAQPGFFWSTFEQVDNDKVFIGPRTIADANKQTAKKPYMELNSDGTPHNQGVDAVRLTKIPADPTINAYYQKLLAGSVFANYRLISTQWQTGGAPQGTPANVANLVQETYVQKIATPMDPKNPKSVNYTGCLACHANATAKNRTTNTDHSFLFLEAK